MGFGPKLPPGYLPVFTVDTEEQARMLITLTCPTDPEGNYYARELLQEQTVENLQKFSDKLARAWGILMKKSPRFVAAGVPASARRSPTPRRRSRRS